MKFIALFISFIVLPICSFADDGPEIDSRIVYLHSDYKVNEDATHTEHHEWAMKVLSERAIDYAKKATITYSTSIQKAEVLAAYTQKPDGKRIDAPKGNYQLSTNTGKDKDAPVFSDQTSLTVVFPEVQVGDTVVFSYTLTQTEPMFPGQFTADGTFTRYYPFDEVRVTLDVPESFGGHYSVRGMSEKVSHKNGRKLIELTYSNKVPEKNARRNFTVWDMEGEPGFIYSTFKSYREIAEAYGVRAIPKAKPVARVTGLAAKIVGDVADKREQARLLYEWVATQISYAGNCIGVGAVVPHDVDFILDNRMGDCKDHATLLQALLAARGIKSTQALINATSVYKLPSLPLVSAVNHVINYLPDFDMFADSTSQDTPFGMLPMTDADKPVLLVEGYREGMKTPVAPVGANQQYMDTVVHVAEDGSAKGEIEVRQKGLFAVQSRALMRRLTQEQEEDFIKRVFRSEASLGKGSLEKDDPTALLDTYHYKVAFEEKEFLQLPGAGAFQVTPLFPNEAPVYRFVSSAVEPIENEEIACSNGVSEEHYTYILPKGVTILAKPDDVNVKSDYLKYSASYELKGTTLTVVRKVEDLTPGNVCSPAFLKGLREAGLAAMKNIKSQVLYQ